MCDYSILLSQMEDTIENNNFNEYAFGATTQNSANLLDDNFIRIVAIKKMLHCLSTISDDGKSSSSFENEYSSRVKILMLKLEKKLLIESKVGDQESQELNKSEDINVEADCENLNRDFKSLENKELKMNQIVNSNEGYNSTIKNRDHNIDDDINDQFKFTEDINEELKGDLVSLAEEMKKSALRFSELMKNEKEVSVISISTFSQKFTFFLF
ncbi:hypothetical protein FG386_002451 [Cryptosporidium ryanae]|uniref:uncharacterized protein n=1 Tax=Cryptosporidium ryanae TaxID=515981 RepID=UPI00351A36D4|nr:hypothetical protein FG386_002451 [Cryptosporidium ryanae]